MHSWRGSLQASGGRGNDYSQSTALLKALKEDDFQGCFNQWKWRWDKCIASEGKYFEGDKNDVRDNM
jgi:hypothetical protein